MIATEFPVLQEAWRRGPSRPASIPWSLVEPHRAQAERNHGQTLERLAERGGLSPVELFYVLRDVDFDFHATVSESEALAALATITGVT